MTAQEILVIIEIICLMKKKKQQPGTDVTCLYNYLYYFSRHIKIHHPIWSSQRCKLYGEKNFNNDNINPNLEVELKQTKKGVQGSSKGAGKDCRDKVFQM